MSDPIETRALAPDQLSRNVSNAELVNLLVQDQVRIATQKLEELTNKRCALEADQANAQKAIDTKRHAMGTAEFFGRVKVLIAAQNALYLKNGGVNAEAFELAFDMFQPHVWRNAVETGLPMWKNNANYVSMHAVSTEEGDYHTSFEVSRNNYIYPDDELLALIENYFAITKVLSDTHDECRDLAQQLADTTQLEKRLLANLTRHTLESNPASLDVLRRIISDSTNNTKLLT